MRVITYSCADQRKGIFIVSLVFVFYVAQGYRNLYLPIVFTGIRVCSESIWSKKLFQKVEAPLGSAEARLATEHLYGNSDDLCIILKYNLVLKA